MIDRSQLQKDRVRLVGRYKTVKPFISNAILIYFRLKNTEIALEMNVFLFTERTLNLEVPFDRSRFQIVGRLPLSRGTFELFYDLSYTLADELTKSNNFAID